MKPRYPVFIPSKGRAQAQKTSAALSSFGVDHYVIVERAQLEAYGAGKTSRAKLLVLPERYLEEYDVADDLGRSKSVGPGAARNFAWDEAVRLGARRHWVMDDNIRHFWRYHRNRLIRMADGTGLRAMEDFCDRYSNVAMAGPQYFMFVSRKSKLPPYVLNTRIYSCNLIDNAAPFRWRGRYNEDTDLSLRMLEAGLVTVQFNAFLQWKEPTQISGGGNSDDFYSKDRVPYPEARPEWLDRAEKWPIPSLSKKLWDAGQGTLPKSIMLWRLHGACCGAKVSWKFSRWHHEVDYGRFRRNELHLQPGVRIPEGDPYPMILERRNYDLGRWIEVDPDDDTFAFPPDELQLGMGWG